MKKEDIKHLNKQSLIDAIVKDDIQDYSKFETGKITRAELNRILDSMVNVIRETVAGGETVALGGFGTFKSADRKARKARNPQTGAEIDVPAKVVPVFKPAVSFKELVNKEK